LRFSGTSKTCFLTEESALNPIVLPLSLSLLLTSETTSRALALFLYIYIAEVLAEDFCGMEFHTGVKDVSFISISSFFCSSSNCSTP
jgi:hypothetical protein